MTVDLSQVKRLKDLTGVGLTDAKQALVDSNGDFDQALKAMRAKGLTKAEKRAERVAKAGVVGNYNHNNRIGVIVSVNCETDFVAKNDIFLNLVKDLAMHIAASNPEYIDSSEVDNKVITELELEFKQKAINEHKPDDIIPKIVKSQVEKYVADKCLLSQPFIKKPEISVGDYIKEHNAILGENILVSKFYRIAINEAN